jgi:ferredoxin
MVKVMEHCPGCGICLPSCPIGALAIEHGKAVVKQTCIECDLCLNKCPVKQIVSLDTNVLPIGREEVDKDVETSGL